LLKAEKIEKVWLKDLFLNLLKRFYKLEEKFKYFYYYLIDMKGGMMEENRFDKREKEVLNIMREKEVLNIMKEDEEEINEEYKRWLMERTLDEIVRLGVPEEDACETIIAEGYAKPLVRLLINDPEEAVEVCRLGEGKIRIISSKDESNIPAYLRRREGLEYPHICKIPDMFPFSSIDDKNIIAYEITIDPNNPEEPITYRVYRKE
jgi:hypothetical protein